jgi:hypothetical protein
MSDSGWSRERLPDNGLCNHLWWNHENNHACICRLPKWHQGNHRDDRGLESVNERDKQAAPGAGSTNVP